MLSSDEHSVDPGPEPDVSGLAAAITDLIHESQRLREGLERERTAAAEERVRRAEEIQRLIREIRSALPASTTPMPARPEPAAVPAPPASLQDRVRQLETEVTALRTVCFAAERMFGTATIDADAARAGTAAIVVPVERWQELINAVAAALQAIRHGPPGE